MFEGWMKAISSRFFGCILDSSYDTMYTLPQWTPRGGQASSDSVRVPGSESISKRS